MYHSVVLSEIKLKRTDTTLDLSQLAKRAKEEREKKIYKDGGREGRYLYVQGGERPGAQSVNSAGPAPLAPSEICAKPYRAYWLLDFSHL